MSERPKPQGVEQPWRPDAPREPDTGLHPATRDFVREVRNAGVWRVVYIVGGFALACVLAGVMGAKAVAQTAKDAGTEAAKGQETRIVALEQQVPQLRQEVFESRKENRADLKALQDALLTRVPSTRLSEPVPPPKMLDGGSL